MRYKLVEKMGVSSVYHEYSPRLEEQEARAAAEMEAPALFRSKVDGVVPRTQCVVLGIARHIGAKPPTVPPTI